MNQKKILIRCINSMQTHSWEMLDLNDWKCICLETEPLFVFSYQSKTDFLDFLVHQLLELISDTFQSVHVLNMNPAEKLFIIIKNYSELFQDSLFCFYQNLYQYSNQHLLYFCNKLEEMNKDIIIECLKNGIKKKYFRENIDLELNAKLILHVLVNTANSKLINTNFNQQQSLMMSANMLLRGFSRSDSIQKLDEFILKNS